MVWWSTSRHPPTRSLALDVVTLPESTVEHILPPNQLTERPAVPAASNSLQAATAGAMRQHLQQRPQRAQNGEVNLPVAAMEPVPHGPTTDEQSQRWPPIFLSIKTSGKFHRNRVLAQLRTWVSATTYAQSITHYYTDANIDDADILTLLPSPSHIINTQCGTSHAQQDLCCKMQSEIAGFAAWERLRVKSRNQHTSFWCHFDDDQYIMPRNLASYLSHVPRGAKLYTGKGVYHAAPSKRYFAPGGAGFCIDGTTTLKVHEYGFMRMCAETKMPDDVTMGTLMAKLGVPLTNSDLFHSQYDACKDRLCTETKRVASITKDIVNISSQISLGWDERSAQTESMDTLHTAIESLAGKL